MTKTRAFLSRVTLLRTNLSPLPIPLLPGFRGRWMTQDLGSSGPGLFVVFCLLEKKKKKSFCYLVFDSDDSFLFYSGPDFYKLFRMSYMGGGVPGPRACLFPKSLNSLSDPTPEPHCLPNTKSAIPASPTSHPGHEHSPQTSGLGRVRWGGKVSTGFS